MSKGYTPQLCIMWAQADLGDLMVAFHTQMEKNSSDNERLLDISRKIKEKAADVEAECMRRIEHGK
ncbi:MAG: hypothetical protein FWD36_03300 [Treponema sp.]|nr:hypothetical protein [Treponema sp.]